MKQIKLSIEKKYKKRKVARSVSVREFNHVILKSRLPILRRNRKLIRELLKDTQERFGIKLKSLAIMEDHIHLVTAVSNRKAFADAFRFFAGMIAIKLKRGKIWRQRIWSRIVKYGRDLDTAVCYVARNSVKAGCYDSADSFVILEGR